MAKRDEKAIAMRYAEGARVVDIAATFGVSTGSVTRIALRNGCERRAKTRKRLTTDEQREIADRYASGELTKDIAARFSVDVNMVARTVRRLGQTVRPLGRQWKGESFITESGYRMLSIAAGDPILDPMRYVNGHVLEHRAVMARALGRPLEDTETVHHINGIRTDNRVENLQLRRGAHGRGAAMQCAECGSHNIVSVQISEGEVQ